MKHQIQRRLETIRTKFAPVFMVALLAMPVALPACGEAEPGDSESAGTYGTVTQALVDLSTCGPSDMALNTRGSGLPSPLESGLGAGGEAGFLLWDMLDGETEYETEGHGPRADPFGMHQVTVDLGRGVTFDEVTIWHHSPGDNPGHNIPESVGLEYFDGGAWQPLAFSRSFDLEYPQPASGFGSYPDVYSFTPAVGSKVRWSFDADDLSVLGPTLLSDVVAIDSGSAHSCAVVETGRVYCWGANSYGQLGNDSTEGSSRPVLVSGLSDAIDVTAGFDHSCAVRETGQVACWGRNELGRLGNGAEANSSTPVSVVGITDAVSVTAGQYHTCALRETGEVACWGLDAFGQLGDDGTVINFSLTPVTVVDLSDAVSVTAGEYHNCAARETGSVVCWGYGISGELGDGRIDVIASQPVSVLVLTDAVAVEAGLLHTCALRETGDVSCWGSGIVGSLIPHEVSDLSDVVSLSGGFDHSCAVTDTGEVSCWGLGGEGQLGNGGTADSVTPVAVSGLTDGTAVTGGGSFNCALRDSGEVVCWGAGSEGQLGTGALDSITTPVSVLARSEPSYQVWPYEVTVNGCPEPPPPESAADADTPVGGEVTTDTEGDGATLADPVETTVTTPRGGNVEIDEGPIAEESPDGFILFGQEVDIETELTAAVDDPIVIEFVIDISLLPPGADEDDVEIFKNGRRVEPCMSPPFAAPDPCVLSRAVDGDDVIITVLTTDASRWTFGVALDSDRDGDGTLDGYDGCPDDAGKVAPGVCGCNVADSDTDSDGQIDCFDQCLGTPAGETVDADGCSLAQLCPCDGTTDSAEAWRNHGSYVACVAGAARAFRQAGLIEQSELGGVVREAARSDCGRDSCKPQKKPR